MELKFRDLRADEIDVRIGEAKAKYFTLLLYKDARVDMDILDETVGAMNWQRQHSRENKNCSIGIYDDDKKEWVWKEDTGTESNTEAEKGLASDSFKRAGTNWGIGRELYTAPKMFINAEMTEYKKDKWKPTVLTNFYVSAITIKDKKITQLTIKAYNKDKECDVVVFNMGNKVEKKPEPKADKPFPEIEDTQMSKRERFLRSILKDEKYLQRLYDRIIKDYDKYSLEELTEQEYAKVVSMANEFIEKMKKQ